MGAVIRVRLKDGSAKLIVVPKRRPFVIGRSEEADLSLPVDLFMSANHLLLRWIDDEFHLFDLGSSNGTRINGIQVARKVLEPGDEIRAGETVFEVSFPQEVQSSEDLLETDVTAAEIERFDLLDLRLIQMLLPAEPETARKVASEKQVEQRCRFVREHLMPPLTKIQEKALRILENQELPLLGLLDAARDGAILDYLMVSEAEYRSLFDDHEGGGLQRWAPHLVALPPGSPLLEILVRRGWGESWGIYLTSDSPLETVCNHLRRFLLLEEPSGDRAYFRWYDPRVLRSVLPKTQAAEALEFFGPVVSFFVEGDNGEELLWFVCTAGGVLRRTVALD